MVWELLKLVDESVLALGRVYHILIYRLRPLSNNGGDRSTDKNLSYLDVKWSQLTRRSLMISSSSLFFLLMSEHHSFGIIPFMSAFLVLILKFYCFHSYFYPIKSNHKYSKLIYFGLVFTYVELQLSKSFSFTSVYSVCYSCIIMQSRIIQN